VVNNVDVMIELTTFVDCLLGGGPILTSLYALPWTLDSFHVPRKHDGHKV